MAGLLDRAMSSLGLGSKDEGEFRLPDKTFDTRDIEQTADEKKLANWVRTKVEEVRSSANRISHEGIWMTNIAYLLGFNGLTYNTFSKSFVQTNDTSLFLRQRKVHVNKILPTVQNRLARLCKNPPRYDVLPESNKSEDKDAARLALDILSAQLVRLDADKKRELLYMWMQECGHSYLGVYWDPSKGAMMTDPESGESDFEGDVRLDVISAFEMFPDPLAKTMEDLQWVIRAKVRPLEYFRSHYPEKGEAVREEGTWLLSAQYESRINSINTRGPAQGTISNIKNTAVELAYYERRSKKYPNGRLLISANGVLLENKDLPVGEIPFVKFDDVVIGGKFYSDALITHLRPIQDAYNQVIRQRTEWVRRLLSGKMVAARGGQLAQEAMNDQSGEIVYYTPVPNAPDGGRPVPLQMPVIPQYAYTEQDKLDGMFNEISGISEVSKGNLPSASIPAIGMQLLVEQDDTRIGVVTENSEHSWAKAASLILKYTQQNYVMPRKFKMAGKSGYIIEEIHGEDIKTTDVKVMRGSTSPGSKVLKRQDILNAYNSGLLGDPSDPALKQKILAAIEFGDVSEIYLDLSLDQAQVKRGLEAIEKGILPPCSEFDNHKMWIEELNRFRKNEKFEQLPPDIQKLVTTVMEAHITSTLQLSGAIPPEVTDEMKQAANATAAEETQKKTAGMQLDNEINNRAANMPGNQPAQMPMGR